MFSTPLLVVIAMSWLWDGVLAAIAPRYSSARTCYICPNLKSGTYDPDAFDVVGNILSCFYQGQSPEGETCEYSLTDGSAVSNPQQGEDCVPGALATNYVCPETLGFQALKTPQYLDDAFSSTPTTIVCQYNGDTECDYGWTSGELTGSTNSGGSNPTCPNTIPACGASSWRRAVRRSNLDAVQQKRRAARIRVDTKIFV